MMTWEQWRPIVAVVLILIIIGGLGVIVQILRDRWP
jgi:hypothetical protein